VRLNELTNHRQK